jgi:hypothetical protein
MFLFIFYSIEEIWLGILNAPFISLEIYGAVQFYFFFFQFYLKEEKEVEISENLMTKKKFDVSIHFLFNIRELISHIKCTVYFTWNTQTGLVLLKLSVFYSNDRFNV